VLRPVCIAEERTNDTAAGAATCTPARHVIPSGNWPRQLAFFRLALFVNQLKRTRRNLERIKTRPAAARGIPRVSPVVAFVVSLVPAFVPRSPSPPCRRARVGNPLETLEMLKDQHRRSMRNVSSASCCRPADAPVLIAVPFAYLLNTFTRG